jgi:7-cyano-7-deazaguanine reductase
MQPTSAFADATASKPGPCELRGYTGRMSDAAPMGTVSVLGADVRGPMDHLEWFPAPAHCTRVRFSSEELSSVCPITGQPDLSSVVIEYEPNERCIESKSLKLYLWSFRDRPAFAEALAAEIAVEVQRAAEPRWVKVVLTQHVRGGIVTEATAEL